MRVQAYYNHTLQVKFPTPAALSVTEPQTLPTAATDIPSPVMGWALDGFPAC